LQSISASIKGSLPENTESWQARFNHEGPTIWIADAHRDGKRFVVRADEKLTAFVELGAATRGK
jgi:hypothetical protein